MKSIFSTFLVLLAFVFAEAQNTDLEVGTLPGKCSYSNSGAATYTIPLELPPGRAGMEPKLAFNYNSHSKGSIMGSGWGITGFSSIYRTNPTQYYNGENDNIDFNNDQLAMDGRYLIYIGVTEEGLEYRTEVDNLEKVIFIEGEEPHFKVYMKNGAVREYGGSTSSRQLQRNSSKNDTPPPLAWHINKIIDKAGNTIEYSYIQDPDQGDIHPSEILYTGFTSKHASSSTGDYRIKFNYNDLEPNQHDISYLEKENIDGTYDEFINANTKLLDNISIYHKSNEIKRYSLLYDYEKGVTEEAYLHNIQLTINNNSFNPTTFVWNYHQPEYKNFGNPVVDFRHDPVYKSRCSMTKLDTDGDGIDEVAVYKVVTVDDDVLSCDIHIYSGNSEPSIIHLDIPVTSSVSLISSDFDFDSKDELLINITENKVILYDFDENYNPVPVYNMQCSDNNYLTYTGDFNGDGIQDCFLADNILKKVVLLTASREENYFQSPIFSDYPSGITSIKEVGDFDGDLIDEVACYTGSEIRIFKFSNTFSSDPISVQLIGDNGKSLFGDFNGDGKTDVCFVEEIDDTFRKTTYFSWGHGFTTDPAENNTPEFLSYAKGYPITADINGDSRTDFIYMNLDASNTSRLFTMEIYHTKKRGVNQSELVQQEIEINNNIQGILSYTFADLTGDGHSDMAVEYWHEEAITPSKENTLQNILTYYHLYRFRDVQVRENHITEIVNGLGKTNRIKYQKQISSYKSNIYSYPVSRLRSNKYLISESFTDNNGNKINHGTYQFSDPIYHAMGKGFLGFRKVTINNINSGTKISTEYELFIDADDKYYQPYPYKTTIHALSNDNILSETINTYNIKNLATNNIVFFPFISQSINKTWDLNSEFIRYEANTISGEDIDMYGNILKHMVCVDENETPVDYDFTSHTVKSYDNIDEYSNNTRYYITGRPASITRESKKTGFEKETIDNTFKYYQKDDNTGYWPFLLSKTISPNKNREGATKFVVSETYNEYDMYGNIKSITRSAPNDNTISERIIEYEYDNSPEKYYSGRFITSIARSFEGVDYTQNYEYDPVWGNLEKLTDPAGKAISYIYDETGRHTATLHPDGTRTNYKTGWAQPEMAGYCPEDAVYYTAKLSTISGENWSYYNSLSQRVRELIPGYENDLIIHDYEYNINGLLSREYKPYYFSDGKKFYTEFFYDELNRLSRTTTPVNSFEFNYFGRSISTTDMGTGIETMKKYDIRGAVIEASDPAGTIKYRINSSGKLSSVINHGVETIIKYDPAGNKESLTESNTGKTSYTHNAFGQLMTQIDGRENTTKFIYDALGRIQSRAIFTKGNITPDVTVWSYNNQKGSPGFGQLSRVIGETEYQYTYDYIGRLIRESEVISGNKYSTQYDYFSGRLSKMTYPSGFEIYYSYDFFGHLLKIVNGNTKESIWEHSKTNALGQIEEVHLGNGLTTRYEYDPTGNNPESIKTGQIQDLEYSFDLVTGNLKYRADHNYHVSETFEYDDILKSRLTHWYTYNGTNYINYYAGYHNNGNINHKSDVTTYTNNTDNGNGRYVYGTDKQVHAVAEITNPVYDYKKNCGEQLIKYNGFNKIEWVTQSEDTDQNDIDLKMQFFYGPYKTRKRSRFFKKGILNKDKLYIGAHYEIEKGLLGKERKLHYISAGDGLTAIYVQNHDEDTMYYILKDYLGSIYCVTDETGEIVNLNGEEKQILSFDPWGRRRNYATWDFTETPKTFLFDRGFTTHEHMDDFDLINMNGRLYDSRLGRMLSPDPFVQNATNSQSFNRYSYAFNNPLKYTDPTGYHMRIHDLFRLDGIGNGFVVNDYNFMCNNISLSSGNHWMNQYLGEYYNYIYMSSTAFENQYGKGALEKAHEIYSNDLLREAWRNDQISLSDVNVSRATEKVWDPVGGKEVSRNVYTKDGITYAEIYYEGAWIDVPININTNLTLQDEKEKYFKDRIEYAKNNGYSFAEHEEVAGLMGTRGIEFDTGLGIGFGFVGIISKIRIVSNPFSYAAIASAIIGYGRSKHYNNMYVHYSVNGEQEGIYYKNRIVISGDYVSLYRDIIYANGKGLWTTQP